MEPTLFAVITTHTPICIVVPGDDFYMTSRMIVDITAQSAFYEWANEVHVHAFATTQGTWRVPSAPVAVRIDPIGIVGSCGVPSDMMPDHLEVF